MCDTFGEYLKNLREAKNLSQADLADQITRSLAGKSTVQVEMVASWEDDRETPSKEIILRISNALDLATEQKRQLLTLASYETPYTFEDPASKSRLLFHAFDPDRVDDFVAGTEKFVSSTDSYVNGSIHSLNNRMDIITDSIASFQQRTSPMLDERVEQKLSPVLKQVDQIRNVDIPMLRRMQGQIKEYQDFVSQNADLLKNAVVVDGLIESYGKRIAYLETQINLRRERTVAVISSVVAILSIILNIYQAFYG